MATLAQALTGVAALAFVLAVVSNFTGMAIGATAEGFSRASTNMALLAIAVVLCVRSGSAHVP
jgi:ABC-type transporter Mla maintaining outer membrane lipid asymmetry permease subunit MlaE